MFDYYDYCVYEQYTPYETRSAEEKHAVVMRKISESSGSSGSFLSLLFQTQIILDSGIYSFTSTADVFPAPPSRIKYVHAVGVVAPIKWIATPAASKYSGIFKQGSNYGIMRLSSGARVTDDENVTPGVAIKLFRDGIPSANILAIDGVAPQSCSETNFFLRNFSNHAKRPTKFTTELNHQKLTQVDLWYIAVLNLLLSVI